MKRGKCNMNGGISLISCVKNAKLFVIVSLLFVSLASCSGTNFFVDVPLLGKVTLYESKAEAEPITYKTQPSQVVASAQTTSGVKELEVPFEGKTLKFKTISAPGNIDIQGSTVTFTAWEYLYSQERIIDFNSADAYTLEFSYKEHSETKTTSEGRTELMMLYVSEQYRTKSDYPPDKWHGKTRSCIVFSKNGDYSAIVGPYSAVYTETKNVFTPDSWHKMLIKIEKKSVSVYKDGKLLMKGDADFSNSKGYYLVFEGWYVFPWSIKDLKIYKQYKSAESESKSQTLAQSSVKETMPEGWSKWVSGAGQSAYEVGIDTKIFRSEPKSYYIKSVASLPPKSNGQVNQAIQADAYLGKRIRVSVFLRGENIKDHGWLYLQANDYKAIRGGADHRMANNSLDWIKCEVVMDVPQNTKKISYGIALNGEGQIWFDDLNLEVVGKDVPETWLYLKEEASKPSNLP